MTATEVLRRMLDERGVEYTEDRGYREFFWDFGESGRARASAIGTKGLVQMIVTGITPEQVISVTLGDVPRLPHFWTHDGALHVELPKLPESISVRLPDARDREVGSARVWQYTRDNGTCHDIWDTELTGRLRFQCSECGAVSLEITPNFCPVCGRRIEVNDG